MTAITLSMKKTVPYKKNDEQDSKDGENDSIDYLFHFKNKYFGLCTHE